MPKNILIVAAHTDDEVLGCGGVIARHVAEGDTVFAVFMTDGVSSRPDRSVEKTQSRHASAEQARRVLGISKNYYFEFPDNGLDRVPLLEVVKALEGVISQLSPQIIYTHHFGDLNIDHRITHQAVMTACRPLPGCTVREIYAFEVMSSTEWATPGLDAFCPDYFVDIRDYLDVKKSGLEAYSDEMRHAPHSRSLEHLEVLARHRGYSVGLYAAEAFMHIRSVR